MLKMSVTPQIKPSSSLSLNEADRSDAQELNCTHTHFLQLVLDLFNLAPLGFFEFVLRFPYVSLAHYFSDFPDDAETTAAPNR